MLHDFPRRQGVAAIHPWAEAGPRGAENDLAEIVHGFRSSQGGVDRKLGETQTVVAEQAAGPQAGGHQHLFGPDAPRFGVDAHDSAALDVQAAGGAVFADGHAALGMQAPRDRGNGRKGLGTTVPFGVQAALELRFGQVQERADFLGVDHARRQTMGFCDFFHPGRIAAQFFVVLADEQGSGPAKADLVADFVLQRLPGVHAFHHDRQFRRMAASLPDKPPVAAGLFARDAALLADQHPFAGPLQEPSGHDAGDAAADDGHVHGCGQLVAEPDRRLVGDYWH